MNTQGAPSWLPSFLVPFVTLSYPTAPPTHPDSFHSSNYYDTGLLDGWLIITCIAVMAILRDVSRIYIMEPFARWFLTRRSSFSNATHSNGHGHANGSANGNGNGNAKLNGNGNGHASHEEKVLEKAARRKEERMINRSVVRFAEQGWSFIYYTIQWCFGLVSTLFFSVHFRSSP